MNIGIVTLGCDKNTADGEHLAGWLARYGARVGPGDPADESLDAVVILTCGFIEPAREESLGVIDEWVEVRARRPGFILAACGCLAQDRADDLRRTYPEIDLVAGVGEFDRLARELVARLGPPAAPAGESPGVAPRRRLAATAYAYLKIADGCDAACAFCAIPRMKGPYRSVGRDAILAEARQLLADGAAELILVAQDISAWGRDLGEAGGLPSLLRDLAALPGDFWIRLLYFYPGGFSDELITVMASEPKICPYLDIPLQHLDPGICRAMRRPAGDGRVMDWIGRLRAALPDVALRTTFIVGFPGEGKREFQNLLDGLGRLRFDHVGFFPFSPEDGTPAADLPGQVSPRTIEARLTRLARRQVEIAEDAGRRFVGRVLDVLVDGRFTDTDLYLGHARQQTPEVDGMVRFVSAAPLVEGRFVRVRIDRAEGVDLIGAAVASAPGKAS